jgi:hypothetical protein
MFRQVLCRHLPDLFLYLPGCYFFHFRTYSSPFYPPQQCFGLAQGVDDPQHVPEFPADSLPDMLTAKDELKILSMPAAPHLLHEAGPLSLDFNSISSL